MNNGSWADQWDTAEPLPKPDKKKNGGSAAAKYGKKVGEGLGKTKAVATSGVNKVKEGTSVGFQWIKDKCKKTKN
ncbi:hypothetical protein ACS0TY_034705 [Phlomoides rotata]